MQQVSSPLEGLNGQPQHLRTGPCNCKANNKDRLCEAAMQWLLIGGVMQGNQLRCGWTTGAQPHTHTHTGGRTCLSGLCMHTLRYACRPIGQELKTAAEPRNVPTHSLISGCCTAASTHTPPQAHPRNSRAHRQRSARHMSHTGRPTGQGF